MDYGLRKDGSKKDSGFLGALTAANGDVMTELSVGVNIDGRETEIPLLVPGLTKKQLQHLLDGGAPTQEIVDLAVEHARTRMKAGKSPFFDSANEKRDMGDQLWPGRE